MPWRGLLDGDDRARAAAAAAAIAAELGELPAEPGLMGAAGRACLHAYVGPDLGQAAGALEAALAKLAGEPLDVSLWHGLAGVRFAVAHLAAGDEAGEALDAIDAALLEALAVEHWTGAYDLNGGLCGVGVAALEGGGAGDAIALRVLDHLEALAQRAEHGVTWFTRPELVPSWQRAGAPDGYHNLGVAHGVPGVIALLAAYLEAGVAPARVEPLLRGAMGWITAAVAPRAPRRFPAWLGGRVDEPAHLAWCYGDAGVAIALWRGARALGDARLEAEARALAGAVAACSIADAGVVDTSLCHGAAGLGHLLNRLYQAIGDDAIGAAARRWLTRLLAMQRAGEGIGGFRARREGGAWVDDDAILSGAAGVALALTAAVGTDEPRWDRVLLCDLAPAGAP